MVKLASFYYIPPFLNIPQGSICDLLSHEDHDYPCPYHETAIFISYCREWIQKFCTFERSSTKASQLQSDKLTAFRDVWTMFIENLKNCTVHFGAQHSRICDEETDFTVENYCKALNALTVKSALNENSSSLYSVSMTINEWPRSVQW
ncbi:hypothetical protein T4B_6695 [Trichinella pseudospiralis]|uniref:Uncharacterized protein n=1 Tax=Trichinella pseudospiralis TaxID=6337 RepID=A0A0V1JDW3_TRIPS|nr:hypothetical protein T4B_6695 [Trichinella pseudospiralis]